MPAVLVHHWKMEEADGADRVDDVGTDDLVSNNNVTRVASLPPPDDLPYAAGFVGSSLQYLFRSDGAGNVLSPGVGDFSISLWLYSTDFSGFNWRTLASKGARDNSSPNGYNISVSGSGAYVLVNFGCSTSSIIGGLVSFEANLVINTWYHLVVTFDRDGNFLAYLDGVLMDYYILGLPGMSAFEDTTATCTPIGGFAVGAWSANSGAIDSYWDGRIDDVRWYTGLLTQDEVTELFTGSPPPVTDPFIRYSQITARSGLLRSRTGHSGSLGESEELKPASGEIHVERELVVGNVGEPGPEATWTNDKLA